MRALSSWKSFLIREDENSSEKKTLPPLNSSKRLMKNQVYGYGTLSWAYRCSGILAVLFSIPSFRRSRNKAEIPMKKIAIQVYTPGGAAFDVV